MKKIFLEMYLKKNLGDDLFLCMMAGRYPEMIFDVSTKKENVKNLKLKNVRGLSFVRRLFNKIRLKAKKTKFGTDKKYLAKVVLGGSMFIEQPMTKQQLAEKLSERYLNTSTPLFVLGANFGPYQNQFYLDEYKKVFKKANDVCFREKYSKQFFKDLDNVRVASDIVFGFDAKKYNSVKQKKKVIISVIDLMNRKKLKAKSDDYELKVAQIADYYAGNGYEVVLMSFCKSEGDEESIRRILSRVKKNKVRPYYYNGDIDEALREIASSEIMVGTRFHSVVLGLVFGKKVLPIIYSDKTKHMLEDLKFKGKMLEIDHIEKFDVDEIDSYVTSDVKIDEQRKMSQEHFAKLDSFIKENA